jgi:hypothetical protein
MKELTLEKNLMDMENTEKHSYIPAAFIGFIHMNPYILWI